MVSTRDTREIYTETKSVYKTTLSQRKLQVKYQYMRQLSQRQIGR